MIKKTIVVFIYFLKTKLLLKRKTTAILLCFTAFSIARLCHTDFFDYLFIKSTINTKYFYQSYFVQTIIKTITVCFLSDVTYIFKVVLKNM